MKRFIVTIKGCLPVIIPFTENLRKYTEARIRGIVKDLDPSEYTVTVR